MEAGKIKTLTPNEELMQESYSIAKRQGITLYDAVFVSLAIKLKLTLKSYDKVQIRALKSEITDLTILSEKGPVVIPAKKAPEATGEL
jgi:predicted nucleic acid-binding protein